MTEGSSKAAARELIARADSGRLDRFLALSLPDFSRTRLQDLVKDGEVTVNGRPARPSLRLKGGERVLVSLPEPRITELQPEAVAFDILYQDQDLVVVDKPAGLVVHPAKGNWTGTLVHGLLHAIPGLAREGGSERPGIVHRIDKGTSGVLVVALHDIALRRLQAQFMIHSVNRRYLALLHGVPDQPGGRIQSRLARHPRDRLRFASVREGVEHQSARKAITLWRVLGSASFSGLDFSLVECRLETGRTHQIRVHLTEMGHPIVGDSLYGASRDRSAARLASDLTWPTHTLLHAERLAFDHPISATRMSFRSRPPADFLDLCARIGMGDLGLGLPESAGSAHLSG